MLVEAETQMVAGLPGQANGLVEVLVRVLIPPIPGKRKGRQGDSRPIDLLGPMWVAV
jgi:hypothetical protein